MTLAAAQQHLALESTKNQQSQEPATISNSSSASSASWKDRYDALQAERIAVGQDLARLATRNGQLEMEKQALAQELHDAQQRLARASASAAQQQPPPPQSFSSSSREDDEAKTGGKGGGGGGDVYNADRDKVTERLRALETIAQEYKILSAQKEAWESERAELRKRGTAHSARVLELETALADAQQQLAAARSMKLFLGGLQFCFNMF